MPQSIYTHTALWHRHIMSVRKLSNEVNQFELGVRKLGPTRHIFQVTANRIEEAHYVM